VSIVFDTLKGQVRDDHAPLLFELGEFEGLPPQPVLEKISELRFLTWRAVTDRIAST
jgi:hypothetical protein